MPNNSVISLFREILDDSSILIGESLKSRFYHIWKTDVQLESLCLLLPRSTDEVSAIVKICNDYNQEIIIHGGLTNLVGSTISNKNQVVISLEKMNKLHLMNKTNPLFWFAIFFGLALLFFSVSAFFMFNTGAPIYKKGLYFAIAGAALTVVLLLV